MSPPIQVLLFDIDGVLVQPGGYRAAVRATLGHYLRQMNLPESLAPDDRIMAYFEAQRITSEWDMTPISLAIILESVLGRLPRLDLAGNLPELLRKIKVALSDSTGFKLTFAELPYFQVIDQIGAAYQSGETPSLAALRLANHSGTQSLFAHLAGSPVLEGLFSATRDWERSPVTRLFQHFTLGSAAFELCYRRPAEVQTPGLIPLYDKSLLPEELTQTLIAGAAGGHYHLAAYTLRASLPPREIPFSPPGFPPEAETALEISNLLNIPMIGYGRLDYLARITGEDINHYLKPSPIQALAAILAALDHNELDAVIQAREFVMDKALPRLFSGNRPGRFKIHVFEDSRGGIEAVQNAVQLLNQAGIEAEMVAWGISSDIHKRQALAQVTQRIYLSTTSAVLAALGQPPESDSSVGYQAGRNRAVRG